MTDYSRLSDFEINFLVAEALNKFEYVSDHNAEGGSAVLCDSLRDCDTYDYCNDPSDAWPIITENKIAIKPKLITKKEYATPSDYIDGWEAKVHSTWFEDKNPLRCAMIVFLMLRGLNGSE